MWYPRVTNLPKQTRTVLKQDNVSCQNHHSLIISLSDIQPHPTIKIRFLLFWMSKLYQIWLPWKVSHIKIRWVLKHPWVCTWEAPWVLSQDIEHGHATGLTVYRLGYLVVHTCLSFVNVDGIQWLNGVRWGRWGSLITQQVGIHRQHLHYHILKHKCSM